MRFRVMLPVLLLMLFLGAPVSSAELHMYAGAGLRAPVEAVVARFEKETGVKVNVEYAGMGQLLARWQATQSGDVFLSGSEFYVDEIAKNDPVPVRHKLVYHTAVPVVRKDKAQGINTLADLAKSDLTLALGDPKAIALGKSGEKMLEASGYGKELSARVKVRGTTIKQVLMYVLNGDVDAAVIGRSDAVANADKLVMLPTPEGTPQEVTVIAVLPTSKGAGSAKQLADYFATPASLKEFTSRGYIALPSAQ